MAFQALLLQDTLFSGKGLAQGTGQRLYISPNCPSCTFASITPYTRIIVLIPKLILESIKVSSTAGGAHLKVYASRFAVTYHIGVIEFMITQTYEGNRVNAGEVYLSANEQRHAAIRQKGDRIFVSEISNLLSEKVDPEIFSELSTLEVEEPKIIKEFTSVKAAINAGPRYVNFPWYAVGDQRLKAVAKVIAGAFDYNSINNAVISLINNSYRGNWNSHIWDDAWLWYSLPSNQEKYWVFAWYNYDFSPSSYEYGWMAVRNRPSFWEVRANDGSYFYPSNNSQVKKRYITNGYTIDLDFFNPNNEGDWTPNDFWYGFGF